MRRDGEQWGWEWGVWSVRRDEGAVWVGVGSVVCEEGLGSSVGGSGECGV